MQEPATAEPTALGPEDAARARRARLLESVERYTELPLLVLALVFLVILTAPWVADLPETWQETFDFLEWVIWAIFAADLVVRTALAEQRLRYLRRHWIDVLIVVVPFLRPLRILRLVRLVVVGVLVWRYWGAFLRRRGLYKILLAAAALVVTCAGLVTVFEQDSDGNIDHFGDGLWWAMVTITTVGYGDVFPVSPQGRGVAIFLMIMGITIFGVITASLAAFFVETDQTTDNAEVLERLDRIERLLAERAASNAEPGARVEPVARVPEQ